MQILCKALISTDGYLRIPISQALALDLRHLMTGVDEDETDDPGRVRRCGAQATISGYTEWAGHQDPNISIGWDWQLDVLPSGLRFVRVGLPRSNVLIVDQGGDLEVPLNLIALATVVDRFNWQESVCEVILGAHDK